MNYKIYLGGTGEWFSEGKPGGLPFLKFVIPARLSEKELRRIVRLFDILPGEMQVLGRTERGVPLIEIRKPAFSREQPKMVKEALENYLRKEGFLSEVLAA